MLQSVFGRGIRVSHFDCLHELGEMHSLQFCHHYAHSLHNMEAWYPNTPKTMAYHPISCAYSCPQDQVMLPHRALMHD